MKRSNYLKEIEGDPSVRMKDGEGTLEFGVEFLDDSLFGISKSDLILVGAYSGSGKTQLVSNIGAHAAKSGNRVDILALEAEHLEIQRRTLYGLFVKHYLNDPERPPLDLYYPRWRYGHNTVLGSKYEALAIEEYQRDYKNLYTGYKKGDFNVHDLRQTLLDCKLDGSKLVIIDHAHFFDWGDERENTALKEIVTTTREMALEEEMSIILVSHLRKKDSRNQAYAPSLEEFHGSSELYKQATKAITLGPGSYDPRGLSTTYINSAKFRHDGSATKFTARVIYNFKTGGYEKGYELGKSNQKRDREFETINPSDYPVWSRYRASRSYSSPNASRQSKASQNIRREKALSGLPYKD